MNLNILPNQPKFQAKVDIRGAKAKLLSNEQRVTIEKFAENLHPSISDIHIGILESVENKKDGIILMWNNFLGKNNHIKYTNNEIFEPIMNFLKEQFNLHCLQDNNIEPERIIDKAFKPALEEFPEFFK